MKTPLFISGFILVFSALAPDTALSAPAYPLESLLERAENVFIVRVSSRTHTRVTFEVTEVLRGDKLKSLTLSHSPYDDEFPKEPRSLLLFSQGDDYWGKPKPLLSIGQPTKGQASYCGWILWSSTADNGAALESLRKLVKQALACVPKSSHRRGRRR